MLTDESVLEWAKGWLLPNTPEDPTFRQRFLVTLSHEALARLDAIASERGQSRSGAVEALIRNARVRETK